MKPLYLLTALPPKLPAGEAYSQEIALLRTRFPGETLYLNPNHRSPLYIPRLLFGYHLWARLRRLEPSIDLHHLYNADAFAFPVARRLRKPLLYVISSGVGERQPRAQSGAAARLGAGERASDPPRHRHGALSPCARACAGTLSAARRLRAVDARTIRQQRDRSAARRGG
jgi:hypothetical protein